MVELVGTEYPMPDDDLPDRLSRFGGSTGGVPHPTGPPTGSPAGLSAALTDSAALSPLWPEPERPV
jgi:hypothetical protein